VASSIFNSLHIGYSGLTTAQSGINTTSHNISNANTPGYSKQRIDQQTQVPISNIPGDVGNGVIVDSITRVHDEYIFNRYRNSQSSLEFSQYQQTTLEEISDYFPDLEDIGIAKDLQDFFNSWSDLSKDPNSSAQKVVLANNSQKLTQNINSIYEKLDNLQDRLNSEFYDGINEVNQLALEIVNINKSINKIENVRQGNANDLRDQRDQAEIKMARLLNISVFKGNIRQTDDQRTDMGNDYNINIAGFNLVDGTTYHPISIEAGSRFYSANYNSHDGKVVDFTTHIKNGKLGSIVSLRGSETDSGGKAINSTIQEYMDQIDSLSKGLIHSVNSLYASSARESMKSEAFLINSDTKIAQLDDIEQGSFNVVVYNNQGEVVSQKSITIDEQTTLDGSNTDSIVSQINSNSDDNSDNDSTNDVDDIYEAKMVNNVLVLEQKSGVDGYYIAIEDSDTNFAGFSGINRFFEGSSAKDIDISGDIIKNPSTLSAFKSPVDGNNELANDMIDLQYKSIKFNRGETDYTSQTIEQFYRSGVSDIASDAENAKLNYDTAQSLDSTINQKLKEVSDVDMDEELMNLIKYQTAYQASAKIITTIDEMVTTLMGIKQ
jgi:flagellar hook-associated protein 1 FlgK